MQRRTFLGATGLGLGSLAGWRLDHRPSIRGTVRSLVARACEHPLGSGPPTALFGYNGVVPGPVLECMEGESVTIDFENALPEPTTIHWHGLHLPFESDGSPFHPVPPGGRYTYRFTPQPGCAGTYWYHPHPHHRTARQVAMGLAGALIIRAPDDPLAHLPERVLLLSDNRVDAAGAVDLPPQHTHAGRIDFENGREGPLLLVNGVVHPTLSIRSGEVQRWRLINASAARMWRLALEGHEFLHVGSDGGLFERAVPCDELLLAPSERAEVLVRGIAAPGTRAVLRTLPYDRYIPQTRPADWQVPRDVAVVAYTDAPPMEAPSLPSRLRVIPPLDPGAATATRVMALSQGMINGRLMDPERADVVAPLGATEIWEIENLVGMDHPFHLHGFPFQVLDRDGVPEPYRCWKDTVNVPKHGHVRFVVRYDDFPGKWMFHCHILDHEDHGMMGILEVR